MTKITMKRIALLTGVLICSWSSAQLTLNALGKMETPFSFKQQSIIARLMSTQQNQIQEGKMTEFESRCVSSNIVVMLGDDNAERFASIAEKAYTHEIDSLAIEEINFMQTINDKYLAALALVAEECSQPSRKEEHE